MIKKKHILACIYASLVVLSLIHPLPVRAANNYYVSPSGNDSNPGTLSQPWLTIQKCLNVVAPGETCLIRAGTYNESLIIKNSGADGAVITIQNYNGETVRVNSGSSMTLRTSGFQSYYVVDGLQLISSISGGEHTNSIDFGYGAIRDEMATTGGNSNITLRNCYVEGAVQFYGPNNTVENCEFNGRNVLNDGIHFLFAATTNGVIRQNIIHDYLGRGIWIDWGVDNTLIQNNTIYNIFLGIDCDGATVPVTNCKIIKNTFYNWGGGANHQAYGCGIFLEDAFNAIVDKNVLYNSPAGNGIFILNYGNGPTWFTRGNIEYRTQDTNITISNNIIYNNNGAYPILDKSASGIQFYNNTIAIPNAPNWMHVIEMDAEANTTFYPQHLTVRNNIFTGTGGTVAWFATNSVTFTSSVFSNNLYYGRTPGTGEVALTSNPLFAGSSDFHLQPGSPAIDAGYNLGSVVPNDYDGVSRPQGPGYDIGAYEVPSLVNPYTNSLFLSLVRR